MKFSLAIIFLTLSFNGLTQTPGRQSIFAHNDYRNPEPFHAAYRQGVGYIEVDVFLRDDKLLVAHTRSEIDRSRDIESLYLDPLLKKVRENNSYAYNDHAAALTLMVDLKTDGRPTLQRLVEILGAYPEIVACKNLFVTVSGDMPSPDTWDQYPAFIHFDGRPSIKYSENQLKRVRLISSSFRDHSRWNGKEAIPASDQGSLEKIISKVHELGKPVRFWAMPDNPNAWQVLSSLGVDIINTDDVAAAVEWLNH